MTTARNGSRRRVLGGGRADRHPDPWAAAEDWSGITEGSSVEVSVSAEHAYVGRVDAKTPDSSIVWVVSVAGLGRQMYGNRDGVRLRPAAG